jgi:arginase family enzyme
MRSTVTVFPFDLFGSSGTGAGAQLLGDAVREILDDTAKESRPIRGDCLRGNLRVKELAFETLDQVTEWRKRGRQAARQALKAGDFLVWLAGNHLGVLPAFEELSPGTLVVQFDAHLDVYEFHDTIRELSHGNFLKHLPAERPRFVNVGHRDLFQTAGQIAEFFDATFSAEEVATDPDRVAAELGQRSQAADRVWIDLDCDAFDPAYLPAVQQPLPFGLGPPVFLKLLAAVWSDKVLGVSVSEFDPGRDVRDTGLNLLGWLLERVLLKKHEG